MQGVPAVMCFSVGGKPTVRTLEGGVRVRRVDLLLYLGNSEFLVTLLLKSVVTVVENISGNTASGCLSVLFVSKNQSCRRDLEGYLVRSEFSKVIGF